MINLKTALGKRGDNEAQRPPRGHKPMLRITTAVCLKFLQLRPDDGTDPEDVLQVRDGGTSVPASLTGTLVATPALKEAPSGPPTILVSCLYHCAYTCPENSASHGGSHFAGMGANPATKKCYKCSGVGHIARECRKETQCYNCREMVRQGRTRANRMPGHPQLGLEHSGITGVFGRCPRSEINRTQNEKTLYAYIRCSVKRELRDNVEVWLRDNPVRGIRGVVGGLGEDGPNKSNHVKEQKRSRDDDDTGGTQK
ncbi:hypothetical protein C8J57DRAFT_1235142 [Mycena rebaudengoi]|nr:hypothetical protein C8J57DRAFT_1235142 [Mycena rebaudengoi]